MTTITAPDGTPAARFAFGTMQFGAKADETASAAMFDAALTAGINHFDTAHLYAGGHSEQILGPLAAPHRDRLVIATKVGYRDGTTPAQLRADFDLSRRRLGLEVIDILYLHRFDQETLLQDQLETLATLRDEGGIRFIGVLNFATWQVMKAQVLPSAMGHRVDIIQPMYSQVKRQAEVELLPRCAAEAIACAPYSPLGGGLLTGKYAENAATGRLTEDPRYGARYATAFMHDAAAGLMRIAAELGCHPATLAAAWAAAHPAGPTPILSASAPDQLAPSLAALGFEINAALYPRLAALTPAPPPATGRIEETA